jgi:hypothetical protein
MVGAVAVGVNERWNQQIAGGKIVRCGPATKARV